MNFDSVENTDAGTHSPIIFARKPADICRPGEEVVPGAPDGDEQVLIDYSKQRIVEYLDSLKVKLRPAGIDDIPKVQEFIARVYPSELSDEISPFDFFRFLKFGEGFILEEEGHRIVGCLFSIYYDTEEKTAFSIRLGIHSDRTGLNLGYNIMMYSYLKAREHGATVMRALIDCDNFPSLHLHLNHGGWFCDDFGVDYAGLGNCFTIALPLTIQGLMHNKVNVRSFSQYLKEHRDGVDYRVLHWNDWDELTAMYREKEFRVAAFIKAGIYSDQPGFIAFPVKNLI